MITGEWPRPELPNTASFIVRQVDFLREAGIQVDVRTYRGALNPLSYLRAWGGAQRSLSAKPYDLIHAQWGQSALLGLPKRKPLVITFRGSDLQGYVNHSGRYTLSGRVLRAFSRWVSDHADQVILVSEHLARYLGERSYHVIPSGLDLDLFRPIPQDEARDQLNLAAGERRVLFAADPHNPIKRFALAQAAVAGLSASLNARLLVAHNVPYKMMPVYMNACDALILTSAHEGSPNVVKEALACNLPVVAVDVGDVQERIGSVEGCIVCPDDRPETIRDALAQVLKGQSCIDGRSTVLDLDEKLLTQQVISVYEQALSPLGE